MVRVGEMTGRLEEIFLRMFEHLEFERYMREQIRSAIRYPAFVIVAIAVALVIINLLVIPQFTKVYANLKADLPMLTQVVIGISDFMLGYWWLLLAGLVGGFVMFRAWLGTEAGRLKWDEIKLRFPIAGKI